MKLGGSRREDEFEINVISLIDVLLTLLMFFVLTTTFVQHRQMKVTLPQASESKDEAPQNPLILLINREGHFFVNDNEVLRPGIDALKQALSETGADHDRAVQLRADGLTPHQAVVTAMDALGQLGFLHLSIAITPSTETKPK